MLSSWDDYPVHQVAETIRHVGTSDRNFYDRYYFNLHGSSDELFMVMGLGQYPNLRVQDAFACVRRGDRHRGAGGQAQGGEQVVAVAVGQAGEEIRRGRSDQHQVRPAGQLDVAHGGLGARVQQIGVHRVPGQRLHGKRRDELAGALRHHHAYFGAGVLQPADQIRALVGGNASGDTEEDPFIDQSLHAVIPYSILGCG